MKEAKLILALFFVLIGQGGVKGHGRLRSPPGRSSMWRDGFRVPRNYQDNELSCGGRWVHWDVNRGKCGVCGDPYNAQIEDNQPPYGKYAQPILADCYTTGTKFIDAFVQLTANHLGFVEFRLCPNNDFYSPVTQECLDRNVLNIVDETGKNHGSRFKVLAHHRDLHLKVEIPSGMTCSQCVLSWSYVSGNNWGCDYVNGRRQGCGIGRGGQESFFNCADIAILDSCEGKISKNVIIDREAENRAKAEADKPRFEIDDEDLNLSGIFNKQIEDEKKAAEASDDTKPASDDTKPASEDTKPGSEETKSESDKPDQTSSDVEQNENEDTIAPTQEDRPVTKNVPKTQPQKPATTAKPPPPPTSAPASSGCRPVGIWTRVSNMVFWCTRNCAVNYCPPTMCSCD